MNTLTANAGNLRNVLPIQAEEWAPQDETFEGRPGGAFLGLALVMLFDLLLLFFAAMVFCAHLL